MRSPQHRITYDNAFERMFIQFMTEIQRIKKEQKTKKNSKKKAIQIQKINIVVKKQMIANNKVKRIIVRVIRKMKKEKKNRLKVLNKKLNEIKKIK